MQARISMVALLAFALCGCASDQKKLADAQAQIDQLRAEVASLKNANEQLAADLARSGKPPVLSGVQKFSLATPIPSAKPPTLSRWTLQLTGASAAELNSGENQTYTGTIIVGTGQHMIGNASPTTLPTTRPANHK